MIRHPIHLLEVSPWPLVVSLCLGTVLLSVTAYLHGLGFYGIFGILCMLIVSLLWFRDIIREGLSGKHSILVQSGLSMGFLLFLVSEIMLFFSFFWAFFHSSLSPAMSVGSVWPPIGIDSVDTWSLPLLGSIILLSSGFTVTLSHHSLRCGNKDVTVVGLGFTVLLGFMFVVLQYNEYKYGSFNISDSVFGSVFYMTTGLHGLHVIIGAVFLSVCTIRVSLNSYSIEHHVGLESAIFYWHLVDLVWFFVFTSYYWWGS